MTRYESVYALARAYEDEAWGMASGHAWDRLAAIAGEYQRGDINWARAKELVAETVAEL